MVVPPAKNLDLIKGLWLGTKCFDWNTVNSQINGENLHCVW
jgi:hypothetical protein